MSVLDAVKVSMISDQPVDADAMQQVLAVTSEPSHGNLWAAPGVKRSDDDEPHYAVPLVGKTTERISSYSFRHTPSIIASIKRGFIW